MRAGVGGRFLRAAFISYADRALAFLLPIMVLHSLDRKSAYAEIEYVISIAIILASFADLGVRIYLLFAFRRDGNVDRVVALAQGTLGLLLLAQTLGAATFFALTLLGVGETALLFALILCRVAASTVFGVFGQIFILRDRPELSMSLSLLCWMASALVLLVPASLSDTAFLVLFMLPNALAVLLALGWIWHSQGHIQLRPTLNFMGQAIRWSWPLLLATAINLAVGNFAKIYAFSAMPQADMVQIAFYQRLAMILQISHAAIMMVLSKEIFVSNSKKIDIGVSVNYVTFMAVAIGILVSGIFMMQAFSFLPVPWNPGLAILVAAYVLFWCCGAYFEIYVNRADRNRMMMVISLGAGAVFVGALMLAASLTPLMLTGAMALSSLVYAVSTGFVAISAGRASR